MVPAPSQRVQDRLDFSGDVSMPSRFGRHVVPTGTMEFPLTVKDEIRPPELHRFVTVRQTGAINPDVNGIRCRPCGERLMVCVLRFNLVLSREGRGDLALCG